MDEEYIIQQAMKQYLDDPDYLSPYVSCSRYCNNICKYKDLGNTIHNIERFESTYPKLVLSFLEQTEYEQYLEQMFETGNDSARVSGDMFGVKLCAGVQGAEKYFDELGRSYHWSYSEQKEILSTFLDSYNDSLNNYIAKRSITLNVDKVNSFKEKYILLVKDKQPTLYCANICQDNTCQYRNLLQDQLLDEDHHDSFIEIINSGGSMMWSQLDNLCKTIANELNPSLNMETLTKISRCFALQKTYQFNELSQQHIAQIMNNLIEHVNENITETGGDLS